MHCFLVTFPNDSTVGSHAIDTHFAGHNQRLSLQTWMVAGPQQTAADVCEVLGIGDAADGKSSGFVVKIQEYYGFMDAAVWQRMDTWKAS